LARVLPAGSRTVVDRATWTPPAIFGLLSQAGDIAVDQQELTFNQGVGMIAVVPADRVADALAVAGARDIAAWTIGVVGRGSGPPAEVTMSGAHPGQ